MNLPPFLKSRKFWALIVGALIIVLRTYVPAFPISDEALSSFVLLLIGYIVGTGLEDAGAGFARLYALAYRGGQLQPQPLNTKGSQPK